MGDGMSPARDVIATKGVSEHHYMHHAVAAPGSTSALIARACLSAGCFPLATVITPNLSEASALLDGRDISDISSMKAAARDLHALGPQYVLVKGGHLQQGNTNAPAWSSISVTSCLQASSASIRMRVCCDCSALVA